MLLIELKHRVTNKKQKIRSKIGASNILGIFLNISISIILLIAFLKYPLDACDHGKFITSALRSFFIYYLIQNSKI